MSKSIYNSIENVDNLIVTLIKIYPLSIAYACLRASQISGRTHSFCRNRWYGHIRHNVDVFSIKTEHVELVNMKRLPKLRIDEFEKLEAKYVK